MDHCGGGGGSEDELGAPDPSAPSALPLPSPLPFAWPWASLPSTLSIPSIALPPPSAASATLGRGTERGVLLVGIAGCRSGGRERVASIRSGTCLRNGSSRARFIVPLPPSANMPGARNCRYLFAPWFVFNVRCAVVRWCGVRSVTGAQDDTLVNYINTYPIYHDRKTHNVTCQVQKSSRYGT